MSISFSKSLSVERFSAGEIVPTSPALYLEDMFDKKYVQYKDLVNDTIRKAVGDYFKIDVPQLPFLSSDYDFEQMKSMKKEILECSNVTLIRCKT
jgi:hypothetical protein